MANLALIGRINFSLIGFAFLVALISLFFGMVAGTGNLILVFLIVGLLGGVVLVAHPTWLLWVGVVWTLVVAGLLRYFADIQKADWLVYAAALSFWLVAAATRFRPKSADMARGAGMPGFVAALILFYLVAIVNSLINFDGVVQFMVGIKNYLMFFGLTLALLAGAYQPKVMRQMAFAALFIGLLQLPVTLYQFLFVRAKRIEQGGYAMYDSLVEASDSVVGTMGGQKFGGGLDDVLALMAFVLFAGVLAAYRKGLLTLVRAAVLSGLLLIPVLLAETKVIFVYFPIAVMVVAWDTIKRRPRLILAAMIAMPLALYAGLWGYYQIHWSKQFSSFDTSLEHVFSYSFSERVEGIRATVGDMSRRESIEFWWNSHGLADPGKLLLGHGLSQSKMYSSVVMPTTVRMYGMRNLAKTGTSQLLWDTGLIGTILFIGALIFGARRASQISRSIKVRSMDYVVIKATQAGLILMLASLFYRNSALNIAQSGFLLYLLLGIVAYYHMHTDKEAIRNQALL